MNTGTAEAGPWEESERVLTDTQRIAEISRAAEALVAGPPDFLRAFPGEEGAARQQRRAIIIASLRDQESVGRVGVSVDEVAADLEAVLRYRGLPAPDDLRGEVVEILRQLENWQAVDGGLAPDRAERDGLRRRVERDYALARPLRVFLPHWDEIQRTLRRRYISLSANYFAQAITALDTLLDELRYEDTDPLRCHSAWQSLSQAMHGINTESRDFARELRSLRVDGAHPEALADIADRLGILHEKFFRVAAEGAAQVRERLEVLRDDRHAGENVRRLQETLRIREEEWSVGLGETPTELQERLDAVQQDVVRELMIFERFMADSGPGSWREGAKVISLALVELTERIHAAISLRLQQTQAVAALLRRARDLASGGMEATQRARTYLWNASGSIYATLWVQAAPASDQQVRLERWLAQKGGSPLPLVEDAIWERSLRPRTRPAPPPPPQALFVTEDWDPGDDPRIREMEAARARLVEKLIAAGSPQALGAIDSIEELRLLASFLWLPRESAPLRRLGLRIQPPGANMPRRATVPGPGFEVEMDNYRFTATSASRQAAAETRRAAEAAAAMERLSAIAAGEDEMPPPRPIAPAPAAAATHPLEDFDPAEPEQAWITRPLEAITPPAEVRSTRPQQPPTTLGSSEPERAPETGGGRRFWPLPGLLRRGGESRRERQ
ncbi:MAG TPA: hypothetical protein VFQ25_05810 [Ktedonobacterales bacterium]|nr:hypothetical protein [Ktedonobacterales bacterium]